MKPAAWLQIVLLAAAGVLLLALGLGAGGLGWDFAALTRGDDLVWQIRWPRSLGAWLAGALLGLAGALAQGLFRNPLADPFLLGSAAGAALAVTLSLLGLSGVAPWLAQLGLNGAAFAGALTGVLLALALAGGSQRGARLLLAGVVVGVMLGAARELAVLARPEVLLATQAFMLGSTTVLDYAACTLMALALGLALAGALALAPVLDALSLGEDSAVSLGLPVRAAQAFFVALLALATGAAVAQCGLIAFVGLAAPHAARLAGARHHSTLLICSALAGGALLLGADLIARTALAPQELPVGIITALAGGAYLLALLRRGAQDR